MKPTTLIVARHGNTFNKGDVILRVGARTDLPLTEAGLEQGKRIGEYLQAHGLVPDLVVTAPLKRTRQSAEQIIAGSRASLEPVEKEFLTELDYGDDDGRPEEEVLLRLGRAEAPEADPAAWPELGKAALRRWDREFILPVGWGHLQQQLSCLESSWKEFGSELAAAMPDKVIVAVTSNGVARFSKYLLPAGRQLPADELKLATGAFGVYEYRDGQWHCRQWNVRP